VKDLRDFINVLSEAGEINSLSQEVDWYLEAGAIASYANEVGAPAPLFTQIKDYPSGYRLLGSPLAGSRLRKNRPWRRLSLAMGLEADISFSDLAEEYIRRRKHSLKANLLTWGPCKENILLGNEVDMFNFPIPFIHQGDWGADRD
jgi:4-hydroxy-3-polyprenylbenzoate decarboxylase